MYKKIKIYIYPLICFQAPIIISIMALIFFYSGCDSQKAFKPNKINGKIEFSGELQKPIVSNNQVSAKLKNNAVITQNSVASIILGENENLLYVDSNQWLVTNGCAGLFIFPLIHSNNVTNIDREHAKKIATQGCVVSASIKDNLVAGVLADNTLFLYDIDKEAFIFQTKEEAIYAISSMNANPVILDTLVIFPTLDGRLNTIDIAHKKSVKNIIVDTEKFLNNIIYLNVQKDELVSATQKRIYTLMRGESYVKELEIRDIYFDGKYIYALSLNGTIYQFDKTLATLQSVKLPYANLNGILIKDGHLYTFENSGGYLIDVSLENFNYEVFKLKFGMQRWFNKRITLFHAQNVLYINKKIIDFNKTLQKILNDKK